VVGAEPAQLRLAAGDLLVELVDQAQARRDGARPRLGQLHAGEQLPAADAEQVGDGAGLAVREQGRVHALLQAGAVADEMEPEAGPLPLRPHGRVGQPECRDELAA
jgi:hypothetical protein